MSDPTSADPTPMKSSAARVSEFAGSEMFSRLFQDGMALVEETAAYLDGPGRDDAKRLGRSGALAYAADSMNLTTQLMQAASWLLTQRAVAEHEMTPAEAADEKFRLPARKSAEAIWPAGEDSCPPRLADLVSRADTLYQRLGRLDETLFRQGASLEEATDNPVAAQLSALHSAFGSRD